MVMFHLIFTKLLFSNFSHLQRPIPWEIINITSDLMHKIDISSELRKAASTASMLAEHLEIPQEHSSLETTHNLYDFWKFSFPGTEHIQKH